MHRKSRVAIVGMGVVNSQGTGLSIFNQNYNKIPEVKKYEENFHEKNKQILYSKIIDNEVVNYLQGFSLRCIDRETIYAGAATKMAIGDYLEKGSADPGKMSMALGTAMGSIVSINSFDLIALEEGPNAVNPMEFPNTVSNAPASKVGIWFKLKGPSVTISNGFLSSMDAVGYAFDEISYGNSIYVIAGGAEELSENVYKGYASIIRDKLKNSSDNDANEIIGEGSGMLLLTSMEEAISKNYNIYGEITDFFSAKITGDSNFADTVKSIFDLMIDNNELLPEEVLFYSSYLPFNNFSQKVNKVISQCFGTDKLILRNRIDNTSLNYMGLNGVFNLLHAIEDIRNPVEKVKAAIIFDVSCDGKLSCLIVRS